MASHRVADHVAGGDVTAGGAERLAERSLDDVDLALETAHLRDAAANAAIHADGMNLVEIGQRVVMARQRRDLGDRAGVAIHRIDRFEDDDLRPLARLFGKKLFQMRDVIVPEDRLFDPRHADAGDDRGVVHRVRQDQHVGKLRRQRRQAGLVGDIAAGEGQGAFLAVERRQLGLELDKRVAGAGNVAGAAGAGAVARRGVLHGGDDVGVLAHAEIVVGAPDGDLMRRAVMMAARDGMPAGDAFQLDEMPIPVLAFQAVELRGEPRGVVSVEGHLVCFGMAPLLAENRRSPA